MRKKESIYEQLQPYVEVMIACGSLKIYEQGFYVNTNIRINVCMYGVYHPTSAPS